MIVRFLLMLCITLTALITNGQIIKPNAHPFIGKISNAQADFIDENTVFHLVRQHRYVFVGEKHDNPEHHLLELKLIQERFKDVKAKNQGRVVFEMLDDSQDTAITQIKPNDGLILMKSSLNWPLKGGWDWGSYAPLFQEAVNNFALAPGNIDRHFVSKVYKDGEQNFQGNVRFSTALNPPDFLRKYLLDQIFNAHCEMQSRESLTPMLHIQLAKDASMASAMLQTNAAMLIAGGEHVRGETGVPWHLLKKNSEADLLIIQIIEIEDNNFDLSSYIKKAGKADVYWFTDATIEKNYCAEVKGKAAQ